MTTAQRIRGFIVEHLLEEPFLGDDPLAEAELDSLGIEQLIDFLEEEYEIIFTDEELASKNFSSIAVVADLVDSKHGAAADGASCP